MSELPNLKEEIERKAFETAEKLILDLERQRISQAQFQYGIDILWGALSGIGGSEFLTVIDGLKTYIEPDKDSTVKRFYKNEKGRVVMVYFDRAKATTTVKTVGEHDIVRDFSDEPGMSLSAYRKFETLDKGLISNGFIEI